MDYIYGRTVVCGCVSLLALLMSVLVLEAQGTSELNLRRRTTRAVLPNYPRASLERVATGVAVAELKIDDRGRVVDVHVLQTPDEDIALAVKDAVLQWTFLPIKTVTGRPVTSKLTFYFEIENETGRVLNPDQKPNKRKSQAADR